MWELPSYPLSLGLLIVCAGSASGIGALFNTQTKWHGMCLFVLFVITGCIQYVTNTHFEGEIFVDEGIAHDDVHTNPMVALTQAS